MSSRDLRILAINQFFYPDSFGGVERVAYETTRRLVRRGHAVTLVGQRTKPGTPDEEVFEGVRIVRYGDARSRRRFGGRTIDALRSSRPVLSDVLAKEEFDLVLPHHYFPYYSYLGLARANALPEVMTFHASFWQELRLEGAERKIGKPLESLLFGGLARRTETACLRSADRIVVLSEFSREQAVSYYPFTKGKIVGIPGGVDLERFRPAEDRSAVRNRLDLPADRRVVFTARRLVPRMGLENLLKAFVGVRESHPDALLVVAGRGRLEAALRTEASELGLAENVRFVGFVDDERLVEHYQAADLFVLPSLAFEGFGMVTLEALSCGTPAVGTPIGATPEILRPLASQLVLDGTDPPAIRRGLSAVLEWISDPAAAERLRGRAREHAESSYGWDRAIDALEGIFESVLEGTDAPRGSGGLRGARTSDRLVS